MDELGRRLEQAHAAAEALPPGGAPALAGLRAGLGRARDSAARQADTLREGTQRADPEQIVWLSADARGPRVRVAPLEVAPRLVGLLYARRHSVLATSATLTAGGSFDYSVRALGLSEADTLDVGSPFDFGAAALVLLVEDVPEPDAPGYALAAHDVLAAATRAAGGRTLALFTSHRGVRAAADALRSRLAADDIGVLAHDVDGGPARLLRALGERRARWCWARRRSGRASTCAVRRSHSWPWRGCRSRCRPTPCTRRGRRCTTIRSPSTRCRRRCCASARASGG